MSPKHKGHPPKKHHNLAGLQNNSSLITIPSAASSSQANQPVDNVMIARSQGLPVCHKKDEASSEAEDLGDEMDMEDYAESNWDELDDEDFVERLAEMAMQDDLNDLDWIPAKWHGKQTAKKKGKTYRHADVMQARHKKSEIHLLQVAWTQTCDHTPWAPLISCYLKKLSSKKFLAFLLREYYYCYL